MNAYHRHKKPINRASKETDDIPAHLLPAKNLFKITDLFTGSGIYFLCKDSKVVYVGKSVCIASRVSAHLNQQFKDFTDVFYIPVPEDKLERLEIACIHYFAPAYNVQDRGPATAEEKEMVYRLLNTRVRRSYDDEDLEKAFEMDLLR